MTPEEKAKELHFNMCKAIATELRYDGFFTNTIHAKNCALIAVDEILQSDGWSSSRLEWDMYASYWNKVKHEIEKL